MKARIKKTGEIVDVVAYGGTSRRNKENDYVLYIGSDERQHSENLNYYWDFEPIEDVPAEIDWKVLHRKYAGLAMQGLLSAQAYSHAESYEYIAKHAVKLADALIEELIKR